ncbi:TIR domain-containing protein [Frankia sp. Hr75.2]|nr:TIR domain-containing protein [Frankia sp. Hr75.2]
MPADDGVDFFVSYAEADRAWAEWVAWQLEEAGHPVVLQSWDFRPGSHFVHEMHQAAMNATRTLAVLSEAYLTSAYREAEWQAAWARDPSGADRGLLVVRVEDCPQPGLLGQVVGIDLFGLERQEASRRLQAAAAGLRAKPENSPTFPGSRMPSAAPHFPGGPVARDAVWRPGRSPFPGLAAFDASRAEVFKGRDEEIRLLADKLRSPAGDMAGLLVVIGPSGCGKSSLVAAGLAPTLDRDEDWLVLRPLVPAGRPVVALAAVLAAAGAEHGMDWQAGSLADRLAAGDMREIAEELLAASSPARRILLVIDQAEELLLRTGPDEQRAFLGLLAEATGGPVRAVATLRSEFVDRLIEAAAPAELHLRVDALSPLSRELLPLVITMPARLAGLTVDEELVARMVTDTGDGQALPLLAYTLQRLYARARETGTTVLTAALYAATGGVRGALVEHADAALTEATASGRASAGASASGTVVGTGAEQVLAALLQLVEVDADGRPSRRRVGLDQLSDTVRAMLTPFVARRLLTVDASGGGAVTVEVSHERLLNAWPPLAEAVASASDRLRQRTQAEGAAADWQRAGQPSSRLWSLALAVAVLTALHRDELTPASRAFLTASRRHGQRRRRRIVAVLTVLLLLVTAGGITTTIQWISTGRQRQEALRQRDLAAARALLARADQIRARDPITALRLNIAAEWMVSTFDTRSDLASALNRAPWVSAVDSDESLVGVALSPVGHLLATAGYLLETEEYRLRLYDIGNIHKPVLITNIDGGPDLGAVEFSPDGRTLVAGGSADGGAQVRLYDIHDSTATLTATFMAAFGGPPRLAGAGFSGIAISPDGHTLAVSGNGAVGGLLRLYDIHDPQLPLIATIEEPNILAPNGITFGPDGRTLASLSDIGGDISGSQVRLYDVRDPRAPAVIVTVDDGHVYSRVAFSPEGGTLAAAGGGGVTLYDVRDPRAPTLTAGITNEKNFDGVAFSPDGRTLVTTSDIPGNANGGWLRLYDLGDPRTPTLMASMNDPILNGVKVGPDGRTLATHGGRIYDLDDPHTPVLDATVSDPALDGVAFGPDGDVLATVSYTGSDGKGKLRIFDIQNPRAPTPTVVMNDGLNPDGVAFRPDGHVIATISYINSGTGNGGLVRLYTFAGPHRLDPVASMDDDRQPVGIEFSPDGRILATISNTTGVGGHGLLRLYDVRDPRKPVLAASVDSDQSFAGVAFSPDGSTLAAVSSVFAGSGGRLLLYDIRRPESPARVVSIDDDQHPGDVKFSPDGDLLATTSFVGEGRGGGRLRLYALHGLGSPALVTSIDDDQDLGAVAFSPDSRRLVATSHIPDSIGATADVGRLRIYDVHDPKNPTRTADLEGRSLGAVVFHPRGGSLATISSNHSAISDERALWLYDIQRISDLDNGVLRTWACSAAGRGLSATEWLNEVPGIPYQTTC